MLKDLLVCQQTLCNLKKKPACELISSKQKYIKILIILKERYNPQKRLKFKTKISGYKDYSVILLWIWNLKFIFDISIKHFL